MRNEGMTGAPGRAGKTWLCADSAAMEYKEAWDLQVGLVAARKSGILPANAVLLLEHAPVFTLGRRGGLGNLTVPEAFLQECGIPIMHVERGGDITYHGPGQLVGYPIVDLHAANLSVTGYVERLEEVMICTAAHWGVNAGRNAINRGVWVGGGKLGSIGVAVRHGITFHGFALNVNVSLEPFGWINPCGLQGITMTSLARELSAELPMEKVREQVKRSIESVFQVQLVPTDCAFLNGLLHDSPGGEVPKTP